MKTLLKKIVLLNFFLSGTLSITIGYGQNKQYNKEHKIKNTKGEDEIDLSNNPLPMSTGVDQITLFKIYIISQYSKKTLPIIIDSIPVSALKDFEDVAKKMGDTTSGNYILALKIIYGLDPNNEKMSVLYQPLFLEKGGDLSLKKSALYLPDSDSTVYSYQGGNFKATQDRTCIERYKKYIMIDSLGYNPGNDSTGSVRSIVYSFQELNEIIRENSLNHIYILNSAESKIIKGINSRKHVLIIGYEKLPYRYSFYTDPFFMKYGNLSHLCPPSCETHKFDLK